MGDSLDRVDRYLADWARMRPDLDISSTAVVGRLRRVTAFAERELDATLAGFGLSRANFDLLDAIRRLSRPGGLRQSELLAELGCTSGAVSIRLTGLEGNGLVLRRPDLTDRRGVVVQLTDSGRDLIERALPAQAATERRILAPLEPAARQAAAA